MAVLRVVLLGASLAMMVTADRWVTRAYYGPQAPEGTGDAQVVLVLAVLLLAASAALSHRARSADRWWCAAATALGVLSALTLPGDWQVAGVLGLFAMGASITALAYCAPVVTPPRRPPLLRAAVLTGVLSGAWAVWALSVMLESSDFGAWSPSGVGTWTAIAALSVGAALAIVVSRPPWAAMAVPPLVIGAYLLHQEWLAFPYDSIDLTWFFSGPALLAWWLFTALAAAAGDERRGTLPDAV